MIFDVFKKDLRERERERSKEVFIFHVRDSKWEYIVPEDGQGLYTIFFISCAEEPTHVWFTVPFQHTHTHTHTHTHNSLSTL
jgi:hypothetical protein